MIAASQQPRVLHFIPSFGVAGAEQMAAHLIVGLSPSHVVAGASLYATRDSPIAKQLISAGIPLCSLGKRPGFDPRMFAAFGRLLRSFRPHVVHTHLSVLRYALPGLLRYRIPVVVHTLHNLAEYETDWPGRFLHWFAFRRGVLPVAISQQTAVSIKRVYGLECRALVPNGIPIDKYQRSSANRVQWRRREHFEQDAILFTCAIRLEPQKNPLLLVRAFAAIADPRAHLVILGQGTLREQLEAYIRQRDLTERVHLLGLRHDIPECLAAADVSVFSSDWEGNPLAVMEAMAAGLPIISTAVGGVVDLVESGQQGLLVPKGDDAALSNAMRILIDNPERRIMMGHAARRHAVAAFGVERMVQGYAAVYREALAGCPGLSEHTCLPDNRTLGGYSQ